MSYATGSACTHTIVLFATEQLKTGKGYCSECHALVPADIQAEYTPIFAAIRWQRPRAPGPGAR